MVVPNSPPLRLAGYVGAPRLFVQRFYYTEGK